jgi:hypothetical protein
MSREEAQALLKRESNNNHHFNNLNNQSSNNEEENEFLKRKFYNKAYESEKESFLLSVYDYWKAKRLKYVN